LGEDRVYLSDDVAVDCETELGGELKEGEWLTIAMLDLLLDLLNGVADERSLVGVEMVELR
jgi:hypothetical protein